MRYTSRGLRRRRDTDQWEVTLSHKDPITGEPATTYHTITAKTERQAQRRRAERTRMLELARVSEPAPLALAIEIALTTGLRRGEVCALRWSDLGDDGTLTVNHAVGLDNGGVYLKDPKSASSHRTIPLTPRLFAYLSAMKADFTRTMELFGVRNPDAFILGKQDPKAPPYHPTRLTREFTSFCRLNGFDCTFHDLRHTFATMLISDGVDMAR